MKSKLKKFLCAMLSAIICLSAFCAPAYAANNNNETVNTESVETIESVTPRSDMILSEAGILDSTSDQFNFSVPASGTYTVTMSVRSFNGGNGIWTIFQKSNARPLIDGNILGTYKERFDLSSGTYYLRLTSSGKYAYSITINRTL